VGIRNDGSLWAWGANANGRAGLGEIAQQNYPARIGSDYDWESVSAGQVHGMAIRTDGSLWAWGTNGNGRTGLGTTSGDTNSPARVGTDYDWESVSAGNLHTMAIRTDGSLWAWGPNATGRTGIGEGEGYNDVPTRVGTDADWVSVSAGYNHTMAIRSDGSLWATGGNANGRLGIGGEAGGQRDYFVRVGTDTDWESVRLGAMATHAMAFRGSDLWAWGNNAQGRIGDAATADRTSPVRIAPW